MSYDYRSIPYTVSKLKDKVNQFAAARWDIDSENPELLITVWSSVFGKGGSVALDIAGPTPRRTIVSIAVENNHDVSEVREALEQVVDEWNDDSVANYRDLITASRTKVRDHAEKQIAKYQADLERYDKGDWS